MYPLTKTIVEKIKIQQPLIINLTNFVTMDFIANGLLSLGASPVMTQSTQEAHDLTRIARAVVINIGTLNDAFIRLSESFCGEANRLGVPLILDPVGAGASRYRTRTCLNLLSRFKFSIIRGNASEIMALSGSHQSTKGVDTTMSTQSAIESAQSLASHHQGVVAISGQTDAIIDASQIRLFDRGVPLMSRITGSGCLLSAVVGAFHAVHASPYEAACSAVVFYGICGEMAARRTDLPGSFKPYFLDGLSLLPEGVDYE